jgi:hypothetical protein
MTTGTAITIRHSDDIPIKYLGMKYEMKRPYDSALRLMRASKPNLESAKCLLEVASNAGDHRATYALATWYLHGKSPVVSIDKKRPPTYLRRLPTQETLMHRSTMAFPWKKAPELGKMKKRRLCTTSVLHWGEMRRQWKQSVECTTLESAYQKIARWLGFG